MYYEKPEIDIIMFTESEIITGSLPFENLEEDPINGGDDIEYDTDANGV